jgi:hypothetical protein
MPRSRLRGADPATDIDSRIETACRLAQTASPDVADALIETPLMRAAHAVVEAVTNNLDSTEAWANYSAELNRFVDDFYARIVESRGADRAAEKAMQAIDRTGEGRN